MAGSISSVNPCTWYVNWFDKKLRKTWKIYKYKGFKLETRGMAEKLLHAMQNDVENGCFRLEKYTKGETDVIPYLSEWLEAIAPTIAPGTYENYKNSIVNHLTPFYQEHPLSLHEIQYDNLVQLMNSVKREGIGKLAVLKLLHTCLKYAKRSGRILAMPEFPEYKKYQITDPPIRWLSTEDQRKVIEAIPLEHQPIFWWLKYHLRRPGEAMALQKTDWDGVNFTVRRSISARRMIDRTKTGQIYLVPCVEAFRPFLDIEKEKQVRDGIISPFLFAYKGSLSDGKRYAMNTLNNRWHEACKKVGIEIDLYSGLKHSTASQMVNEDGYTIDEVRMAGQWSNTEIVRRYAKTETSRVKALLERKVVRIGSFRESSEIKVLEMKEVNL
jgi:integrase